MIDLGPLSRTFSFAFITLGLGACSFFAGSADAPHAAFFPVPVAQLTGWAVDDQSIALETFAKSCPRLLKFKPGAQPGPVVDWRPVCEWAVRLARSGTTPQNAQKFFTSAFTPFAVTNGGNDQGLFTGYFEPALRGSLTRTEKFRYPLYAKPKVKGALPTREEIRRGALVGKNLELLWVDDPVDAFFLHIQGSGRVVLPDGKAIRVGFAGRNGHPYFAIGRALVDRGVIPVEQVSLQSIRKWLSENPGEADAVMDLNRAYIFFRKITAGGPVGAMGIPLTPERSLAVDRGLLPLGAPIWLETTDPLNPTRPIRRLMVTQDTGSAIKGAVRGDIFWGAGALAKERAGRMKQQGRYFILLPKGAGPGS